MITINDIKKAIQEYDKICRPFIVCLNPEDANLLREGLPDLDKRVVVAENIALERGTVYVIERKKIDEWIVGGLK